MGNSSNKIVQCGPLLLSCRRFHGRIRPLWERNAWDALWLAISYAVPRNDKRPLHSIWNVPILLDSCGILATGGEKAEDPYDL